VAKFIQHAIKHPGRLTEAAARSGVSKRQKAEEWSHSDDPSKRGAGNLGLRFMKGGDIHASHGHVSPSRKHGR